LEESYAEEDSRFVELLRSVTEPRTLEPVVNRWLADPRPWAKAEMLRYLDLPFDRTGHAVVVKRLFKHAEKTGDDRLMGAFMVAFDCLIRRVRKKQTRWDSVSRSIYETEVLITPRNSFGKPERLRSGKGWEPLQPRYYGSGLRLFTYRTRYYLQRRAWRYFRRMGWKDPQRYVNAVAAALARYREEDFRKGENLLDSWAFMHACFAGHGSLLFTSSRAKLRDGRSLGDLSPSPAFAAHWQNPVGLSALARLAAEASSRPVRTWAVRWMAAPEMAAAGALTFADLQRLLFSTDEDIQPSAVRLLEQHPELGRWTVAQWLSLLDAPGHAVTEAITAQMKLHVRPDRLDAAQCMALACARPVPVARMGFEFLKSKNLTPSQAATLLPQAAKAACAAVAPDLIAWALDQLQTAGSYDREHLSAFFDSLLDATRLAAWQWLERHKDSPAWEDSVLWSRLAETPFDDLRLKLIDTLAIRASLPGRHGGDLAPVWTAVLLGVHRGGRQKLKAVHQIADAVRADESLSERLLPVLAVAVRSIRGPERRAGLAAVVGLATRNETMEAAVKKLLPELHLSSVA
jgi:hypothetical protein